MYYIAEGVIDSHLFPKNLKAKAGSYKELVWQMAQMVEDIHFYTVGSSSYIDGFTGKSQEAYTKDLIWPTISWSITRVEETT